MGCSISKNKILHRRAESPIAPKYRCPSTLDKSTSPLLNQRQLCIVDSPIFKKIIKGSQISSKPFEEINTVTKPSFKSKKILVKRVKDLVHEIIDTPKTCATNNKNDLLENTFSHLKKKLSLPHIFNKRIALSDYSSQSHYSRLNRFGFLSSAYNRNQALNSLVQFESTNQTKIKNDQNNVKGIEENSQIIRQMSKEIDNSIKGIQVPYVSESPHFSKNSGFCSRTLKRNDSLQPRLALESFLPNIHGNCSSGRVRYSEIEDNYKRRFEIFKKKVIFKSCQSINNVTIENQKNRIKQLLMKQQSSRMIIMRPNIHGSKIKKSKPEDKSKFSGNKSFKLGMKPILLSQMRIRVSPE